MTARFRPGDSGGISRSGAAGTTGDLVALLDLAADEAEVCATGVEVWRASAGCDSEPRFGTPEYGQWADCIKLAARIAER